jgi:CheY-like chemotaxis protein
VAGDQQLSNKVMNDLLFQTPELIRQNRKMVGTRPKLIVVEDNKTDCFIIERVIRGYDPSAEVVIYTEPQKALEHLRAKSASVTAGNENLIILLDLQMPGIDGWQFLEEFEKLPVSVRKPYRLYILTSSISPLDKIRAEGFESVIHYFNKPLTASKLNSIL